MRGSLESGGGSMTPGDQVVLGVAELADAAKNPCTDASTRTLALWALERFYAIGETSMGGAVEREQLLRTYGRRVKRKAEIPSFPQGTEEFLLRLTAEVAADPIVVVAREAEDGVVFFFCDADLSWMIGCVVSLQESAQDS